MSYPQLENCLKELRLPVVLDNVNTVISKAAQGEWSYDQFLLELLELERDNREKNRIERNLRASGLNSSKTFESLDRKRFSRKINTQIDMLMDGSFLDRCENVLLFGTPGGGKTHVASALASHLIYNDRRLLFKNCSMLVQELMLAKKELTLSNYLKKLRKFDAVVIDDIGYVQQTREEMELLFTLLADLYERRSIIITSNLPFSGWEQIFKDPMTTAAAIDRLVHHSIIIEINITSFRFDAAKQRVEEVEKKSN